MTTALEMAGVSFAYPGGGARIADIDVTVRVGGTLAIVGPNGSGKTTMLRLASGALSPSSGRVRVCGDLDPARAPGRELARRVAVVAAHTLAGFPYSAEEVVLMGRAPHVEGFRLESQEDLRIAHASMEAMDVSHLAQRDFDSLSSGEKQRVAVARALAQQPQLLLLDEPAAFLDIKHQVQLYDLLWRRCREGSLTVVSVLHDLNLAALYFESVAMLHGGRIFAQGAPGDVITYANVKEVFETDVYVDRNHLTGHLNVLPLPLGVVASPKGP
ncbi:MAG TPA: ABC transporter ATP-binding protein [Candidatus Limnocylindrales bacterium]|nr:ABC transporter ATP-binding protein [Candidatus Limnocylindrales bacterium]